MPDVNVLGEILAQVGQLPGRLGLGYLQYMDWRTVAADAPMMSKVLFFVLGFILLLFLALVRRRIFNFTIHGVVAGFVGGVIVVLLVEAGLVLGGRSAVRGVAESGVAPGVGQLAEEGVGRLSGVLGVKMPDGEEAGEREVGAEEVLVMFEGLSASEAAFVEKAICGE